MRLIHTLPFLIRAEYLQDDMAMAATCLGSLQDSDEARVVLYNQGCLSRADLTAFLSAFRLEATILGDGQNIGIAPARQACFRYIWDRFPDLGFISEIHLDMIFPKNWYEPLITFLEQSDEPMIAPGIVTANWELHPTRFKVPAERVPSDYGQLMALLQELPQAGLAEGLVHPVLHRAPILKEVGGYDTRFLRGRQGFEDDSLLLGYLYYMGTRTRWRPKSCLGSWVYHAAMAQRMTLMGDGWDVVLNLGGLLEQYGSYGIKHLSALHAPGNLFESLFPRLGIQPQPDSREGRA